VTASLPPRCFGIFCTLDRTLSVAELEAFRKFAIGEEKLIVLFVAADERVEEVAKKLFSGFFGEAIVEASGKIGEKLKELLLLWISARPYSSSHG